MALRLAPPMPDDVETCIVFHPIGESWMRGCDIGITESATQHDADYAVIMCLEAERRMYIESIESGDLPFEESRKRATFVCEQTARMQRLVTAFLQRLEGADYAYDGIKHAMHALHHELACFRVYHS